MVHRNARLTPAGRRILVNRIEVDGWPVAVAAESMGVSRETAYRWLRRFRSEGVAGLEDRWSRPWRSPNQTPVEVELAIAAADLACRDGVDRIREEVRCEHEGLFIDEHREDLESIRELEQQLSAILLEGWQW